MNIHVRGGLDRFSCAMLGHRWCDELTGWHGDTGTDVACVRCGQAARDGTLEALLSDDTAAA